MVTLKNKNIPKRPLNAIFKGMKVSLKNPKNYEDIENTLSAILKSSHNHPTLKSYANCAECGRKRERRGKKLLELGFKDFGQYIEWRKIMHIIKEKKDFQIR